MKRIAQDPMFREKLRVSGLIYGALKRKVYTSRSQVRKLVGITYAQFVTYLGYVGIPEGYTLDHIVPFSQCKTIEEWHKLQNYRNLRLIPRKENEAKSDSKTPEGEILCRELLGREWVDKKRGRRVKIALSTVTLPS